MHRTKTPGDGTIAYQHATVPHPQPSYSTSTTISPPLGQQLLVEHIIVVWGQEVIFYGTSGTLWHQGAVYDPCGGYSRKGTAILPVFGPEALDFRPFQPSAEPRI